MGHSLRPPNAVAGSAGWGHSERPPPPVPGEAVLQEAPQRGECCSSSQTGQLSCRSRRRFCTRWLHTPSPRLSCGTQAASARLPPPGSRLWAGGGGGAGASCSRPGARAGLCVSSQQRQGGWPAGGSPHRGVCPRWGFSPGASRPQPRPQAVPGPPRASERLGARPGPGLRGQCCGTRSASQCRCRWIPSGPAGRSGHLGHLPPLGQRRIWDVRPLASLGSCPSRPRRPRFSRPRDVCAAFGGVLHAP